MISQWSRLASPRLSQDLCPPAVLRSGPGFRVTPPRCLPNEGVGEVRLGDFWCLRSVPVSCPAWLVFLAYPHLQVCLKSAPSLTRKCCPECSWSRPGHSLLAHHCGKTSILLCAFCLLIDEGRSGPIADVLMPRSFAGLRASNFNWNCGRCCRGHTKSIVQAALSMGDICVAWMAPGCQSSGFANTGLSHVVFFCWTMLKCSTSSFLYISLPPRPTKCHSEELEYWHLPPGLY